MEHNKISLFAHFPILILGIASFAFITCEDNSDSGTNPLIQWTIKLSNKFEVPAANNIPAEGILEMQLWDNNVLDYAFIIKGIDPNDALASAYLQAGDVLTNGPVIIDLAPQYFNNNTASGSVLLRASLADSLKNTRNQIYFNLYSAHSPDGIVRGQVNTDIVFATDLALTGQEEIPPVNTTATGYALLRFTRENKLYSRIDVTNLESDDELVSAHIHYGTSAQTGEEFITLCDSRDDFGVNKTTSLSFDQIVDLKKKSTYINVESKNHDTGLIRGEISRDRLYSTE